MTLFIDAKIFYLMRSYIVSYIFQGISVELKLAVYISSIVLIVASACHVSQCQLILGSGDSATEEVPANYFQGVGGEFGKAWISNFLAQSGPPVQTTNNTSLWTWGGMPVGKTLVNGTLAPAAGNGTVTIGARDWMGETPLGTPVYLNSSYNIGIHAPLSDMYLSDDPWIRAQQLGMIVKTSPSYQPAI